ncbi:MAG: class I SAM-dependent methyltransferase [Patescibacteria group bacterium]
MNQQKIVKKINELYHNWEAGHYLERHPEIFQGERDNWEKFVAKFFDNNKTTRKILDVGCGTGFVAQTIGKYLTENDEFFCSDISPNMLEIAEKNIKNKNFTNKFYFLKGSIEELTFEPQSLDFIIINSVLHHLPDIDIFFKQVDVFLKHGGKLVVFHEPNKLFFQHWFLKNNFLLLRYLKNIVFKSKNNFKKEKKKKAENGDIFDYINKILKQEELIIEDLSNIEIKQFIDYGSPTASGKIDKDRGFDIQEIQKKYLNNFNIIEFTTYNYLCKINHHQNFILNLYNFLLSKIFINKGSSFGAVFEKQ